MKTTLKRLASLLFVIFVAVMIAGCKNPFLDSWSGETIDDVVITFEGKTYTLSALQNMKVPPGNYSVIVESPNHHAIETTLTIGPRDIPEIRLVPYLGIYSPFAIQALLCPGQDMRGQPLTPRWNYLAEDVQVIAWVMWNLQDDSYHYQTTRWYRPDGILYSEQELSEFKAAFGVPVTTSPSLPLHQAPGWGVAPPIDLPGIWVVEIILDNTCAVKMSFSI